MPIWGAIGAASGRAGRVQSVVAGSLEKIRPVILCGGGGMRLWPLSNAVTPKQFLHLTGPRSMLAETLARVSDPAMFAAPLAVGAVRQEANLRTALPGVELLLEPVGRNSAPAIAAAALASAPDALLLVLPSDHHIGDVPAFHRALLAGREAALAGDIVTFGITPDHPATGYGYIRAGSGEGAVLEAEGFVEKPDLETAKGYLAAGGYYWNAGIFLFRADTILAALDEHAPDIVGAVRTALRPDGHIDPDGFAACRAQSIDYAVMEKAGNVRLVPVSMGWSDVGDYRALHELGARADGNRIDGPVIAENVSNSLVRSEGPVIGVRGVSGLAVIATASSVLVTPLAEAGSIRALAEGAPEAGRLRLQAASRARVGDWLAGHVLPGWAGRAFDTSTGGFVEALDMTGEPMPGLARRGRVAPRQLYAFANARRHGWDPDGAASAVIERALAFLDGPARSPKGGWAHGFAPDGAIADTRRDLYDHAFIALAGAEACAAGFPQGRALAQEAFETIDRLFADQTHGGWEDRETAPGIKRANPHMHLLEASIAWYEVSGEAGVRARMEEIAALFEHWMFDTRTGALLERFTPDWKHPADRRVEPGHCHEWAGLLYRVELLTGRDTASWRRRLVRFAEAQGVKDGLALDLVDLDGGPAASGYRLWPQLERLRALLASAEIPSDPDAILADIERHYLEPGPRWGWVDALDAAQEPAVRQVPASMLYHLMTAFGPFLADRQ
ncbi:AGE family epimerase/isomerase [Glycocaulis sp.]